jgi:hypothetical protein
MWLISGCVITSTPAARISNCKIITTDYVSNPVHDTAIRKTDGKLMAVRLSLSMLGMTPVAQNTIGIQYYCSAATVA